MIKCITKTGESKLSRARVYVMANVVQEGNTVFWNVFHKLKLATLAMMKNCRSCHCDRE